MRPPYLWLPLAVLAAIVGCTAKEAGEGTFTTPPGFPPEQGSRIGRTPGAFHRQGDRVHASTGPQGPLSAAFPEDLSRGVRYASRDAPEAFVEITPLGARPTHARVRDDGAVLAYEGLYEGVSAAFSVVHDEHDGDRIEEFLSVPSEERLPQLRYTVRHGPGFGWWSPGDGDDTALYAFAASGTPLLRLEAPVAIDASGARFDGVWEVTELDGGRSLRAVLPLAGARYPLLIDPTVTYARWSVDTVNMPPALGAAASTSLEIDGSSPNRCALLFGGATNDGGFALSNATYVRCTGWQPGDIAAGPPAPRPSGRTYPAVAFHAPSRRVYLFGGHDGQKPLGDLWTLAVSTTTPKTGSWSPIEVAPEAPHPSARMMHGAAILGDELLIFGGVDAQGNLLTDVWSFHVMTGAWARRCENCYPGRYGATAVQTRSGRIYSVGGYDGAALTGAIHRWNVAASTWDLVTISDAHMPSLGDGSLDTSAAPTPDRLSPEPRMFPLVVDATFASSELVVGSGVAQEGGVDRYLTDAWLWYRGSTDLPAPHAQESRWYRWGTNPAHFNPGTREAATAALHAGANRALIFGGTRDASSSAVVQRPRLLYPNALRPRFLVARVPGGYRFDVVAGFGVGVESYVVIKNGDVWGPARELACGTPAVPHAAPRYTCTLTDVGENLRGFGLRVRALNDQFSNTCSTNPSDPTCPPPTAFVGAAVCRPPTSETFSCNPEL